MGRCQQLEESNLPEPEERNREDRCANDGEFKPILWRYRIGAEFLHQSYVSRIEHGEVLDTESESARINISLTSLTIMTPQMPPKKMGKNMRPRDPTDI